MTFFVAVEPPHLWVRTDRRGRPAAQGTADTLGELTKTARNDGRIVAVLPGEWVVTRRVSVPATSRRKAIAAIPYALEETLTEDIDELHFAVLAFEDGNALVGVASRSVLRDAVERFLNAGMRVSAMVADYQLLPIHPDARATVAHTGGDRICMLDADGVGSVLDSESLVLWWNSSGHEQSSIAVNRRSLAASLTGQGATVSEWDIGRDFGAWLRHRPADADLPDLLSADLFPDSQGRGGRGWAVAAILFGIAVAGRIGLDGYDYWQLEERNAALDGEIAALVTDNFPSISRVVNPRVQLQQEIDALRTRAGGGDLFPALLQRVATAVPAVRAEVTDLSYREEALTVGCTTTQFSSLDALRERLAAGGGVEVELVSSGSLDNKVTGRFRIRPAAEGR